ncbi:MAG: hypothetical protein ACM30G_00175, partial [Micromonosporaceae bacterium]
MGERAHRDWTQPDRTEPDRTEPDRTEPDVTWPDVNQAEVGRAGVTGPDPSQAPGIGRHARPDDIPVFGRAAVPVPSVPQERTDELPVVPTVRPDQVWTT